MRGSEGCVGRACRFRGSRAVVRSVPGRTPSPAILGCGNLGKRDESRGAPKRLVAKRIRGTSDSAVPASLRMLFAHGPPPADRAHNKAGPKARSLAVAAIGRYGVMSKYVTRTGTTYSGSPIIRSRLVTVTVATYVPGIQ